MLKTALYESSNGIFDYTLANDEVDAIELKLNFSLALELLNGFFNAWIKID